MTFWAPSHRLQPFRPEAPQRPCSTVRSARGSQTEDHPAPALPPPPRGSCRTAETDPKQWFLIVRFAVAKYVIVLGQEGSQLSRILRIGDSQWVPRPAPPIDLLIDGLQYRIDGK